MASGFVADAADTADGSVAAAIVLTGGRSRRMGTDKATLIVDGSTLVDRVLGAVAEAGIETVVIAGPGQVRDPDPGQGPLGGIVAGWSRLCESSSVHDPVVVLACDLPRIDAAAIRTLVALAGDHRHGAVAHDGARRQPLIAAYRAEALDELVGSYEAGVRSVRAGFAAWDLGEARIASTTLADADRPEDLAGFDVEWPL